MDGSRSNAPEHEMPKPAVPEHTLPEQRPASANRRWVHFAARATGVVSALLVSGEEGVAAVWGKNRRHILTCPMILERGGVATRQQRAVASDQWPVVFSDH